MTDVDQISVQLYTVRDALAADFDQTLGRIADIGYTQVEPFALTNFVDQLEAGLAKHGLRAPTTHVGLLSGDQGEIFTAAERLGIQTVIEPAVREQHWQTEEDIAETAAKLNAAAEAAAGHGLRVGYHNHWWEIERDFDGRRGLEVLAEHLSPEVILEVDTYWAVVGGADVPALLRSLGDRVVALHIKDGDGTRDTKKQLPLGAGTIPIWDFVAARPDALQVVELDDSEVDLLDAVEQSYAYITKGGLRWRDRSGVGIIGAGVISGTYIENLSSFPDVELLAIGDLLPDKATASGAEHNIPASGDSAVVLEHPGVSIVVDLTTPDAHADVARSAIAAGKHVWNEKPLALDVESAGTLLAEAEAAGLRVGGAPDTFLGSGLQHAFRLLHEGIIGDPLTGLLLMQQPGPDRWHPNPAFLFQEGAGPVFDIGPYYLTAMVQIFGPVASVAAVDSKSRESRTIVKGPQAGQEFPVTVPSQSASLVKFASGQSIVMLLSFDSAVGRTQLEVTGLEGTMLIPDPNMFDGEIKVTAMGAEDWETVATTSLVSSRGTGVLEMARAISEGRPHRAQGALAYHVLEIMSAIAESGRRGEFVSVQSTVEPAPLLPPDWDPLARTL